MTISFKHRFYENFAPWPNSNLTLGSIVMTTQENTLNKI